MKVKADEEVLEYLRSYFKGKEGKAVRFQLAEVCCGTADLEMIYDKRRDDDIFYQLNDIVFVANKEFGFLLSDIELEKKEYGVDIKKKI